jgi:hypothetical protein
LRSAGQSSFGLAHGMATGQRVRFQMSQFEIANGCFRDFVAFMARFP